MNELYEQDVDAFWRLVKFEAEHESDRLAYYQQLEDLERERRRTQRLQELRDNPPVLPPGGLTLEVALAKLERSRRIGSDAYMATCPLHEDALPSLLVRANPEHGGLAYVHCFAGCDWKAIKDWLRA